MPRGLRAQIPVVERVEDAEHMEEDAPAPQQGGRRGSVVISRIEYEFLCGANQRMDDYHQLRGNHLQYHLGNINERTHSLAKDIKLSAYGRHPIAYPFNFLLFPVYFYFYFVLFSFVTLVLCY